MSGLTLLATLLPISMASPCSAPRPAMIDVRAIHEPVAMRADYSLAELADLAALFGQKTDHSPLGFYSGTVADDVVATEIPAPNPACGSSIQLNVSLRLTERRIQIAHDLESAQCRDDAIILHYRNHANADDVVFGTFARTITNRLDLLARSDTPLGIPGTGAFLTPLRDAARQIIEEALPELKAERAAARASVDTPLEIERLSDACSQKL